VDRHQEASSTSQLGWYPEKPPSYTAKLKKILLKKRKKIITKGGGTRPRPSKKTGKKTEKKTAKQHRPSKKSRGSVIRKSTSIPKEIKPQISRKAIQPNHSNS